MKVDTQLNSTYCPTQSITGDELINLLYPIYFAILALLYIKLVLGCVFSCKATKVKLTRFGKGLLIIPFFPVLLLHRKGRKKIVKLIK